MQTRTRFNIGLTAAAALAGLLVMAAPLQADRFNERTILEFSEPILVPGATLAPGRYIFELGAPTSSRHIIHIRNEQTSQLVATVQAVPTSRPEANDEVVLRFNPTEQGAPLALKAWFYPGERTGHEFVYPEAQAREIAERTKTIVLGIDTPGADVTRGEVRIYDGSAKVTEWRGDAEVLRSWEEWQAARGNRADQPDATNQAASRAPAIVGVDAEGTRVELDVLEDEPEKFVGQRISVDAEVEEVIGPRLFTIDEQNWADFEGELLVLMSRPHVGLLSEDDRITVTGTMRPFGEAELDREWGWLELDPETELELKKTFVLVADRVVGGDNDVVYMLNPEPASRPVGTAGRDVTPITGIRTPIAELASLAEGDEDLVRRWVDLNNVRVSGLANDGGFFVAQGDQHVFVLPASDAKVNAGDEVSLTGVVMRMPARMNARLEPSGELNDEIYLYAATVKPQK